MTIERVIVSESKIHLYIFEKTEFSIMLIILIYFKLENSNVLLIDAVTTNRFVITEIEWKRAKYLFGNEIH